VRDPRFAKANAWEQHKPATPEEIADARANGRRLAEGPADAALLQKGEDALKDGRPGVWQAFHDEIVAAVCEDDVRRVAWTSVLKDAFAAARVSLPTATIGKQDERMLDAASREWQERRDPFSVWRDRDPHISHHSHDLWSIGRILLRVSPVEGLRAIDSLPYPGLMKEILHLFCQEDRALIEKLISAAPPVFDEKGTWTPDRSVAALLVVDLVTKHAEALHAAVSRPLRLYGNDDHGAATELALGELEKHELPDWMRHAFDLVLARPDGGRIAIAYLAELSRERLLGRVQTQGGKQPWRVVDPALVALATVLGQARVGVGQVRDAWWTAEQLAREAAENFAKRPSVVPWSARPKINLEGEGARSLLSDGLPFLFGGAVLLGDAARSSATDLELLWSWLEELLVGRDPGLSLVHHGTSLADVPQHLGFLLSRLPDPRAVLRMAYGRLEPQRRRMLFAYRYKETYPDLESVFLLRVGLNAAVNWLDRVKDGEQAEAARDLFFSIFEAARRLWLTAVMDTGDTKRQLVIACHAFMPFLFGKRLPQALKRTLPAIANDARMLAEACVILRLNSLKAEEVSALAAEAGADLPAALHEVHQWSRLTGLADDFPEHFQKLATELGLSLAATENV
jgi:hypothetical protein